MTSSSSILAHGILALSSATLAILASKPAVFFGSFSNPYKVPDRSSEASIEANCGTCKCGKGSYADCADRGGSQLL